MQIAPDYTDRNQESVKIRFYRVTQSISGTLHEVKRVSDVTAEAVLAGATDVREASLRTSELRKYRDEARAKAVQAAKEKATALASELGAKVGKPYTITEGAAFSSRQVRSFANNISAAPDQAADGAAPAFAPGSISIDASVSVSFILE